jgi:hypothetical protein
VIDTKKLTKIEKIIYEGIDIQEPDKSEEQRERIFLGIKGKLNNNQYLAVEDGGLVLLLRGEDKSVLRMDIFMGEEVAQNTYSWITSGKRIMEWIFNNTEAQFVYGYSRNPRFVNTTKKGGWSIIGEMPNCLFEDGEYKSGWMYGANKKDYLAWLEENPYPKEKDE